MKMADNFAGKVVISLIEKEHIAEMGKDYLAGELFCLEDEGYWIASHENHMKAAAHAINCHDKLVEALQRLCELIDHPSVEADETATEIIVAKQALVLAKTE